MPSLYLSLSLYIYIYIYIYIQENSENTNESNIFSQTSMALSYALSLLKGWIHTLVFFSFLFGANS